MKIIFDSEEEKDKFIDSYCIGDLGYEKPSYYECEGMTCEECFSKYVKTEIKEG